MDEEIVTLSGKIDKIIYRNKENGYTVLEIENDSGSVIAVGLLSSLGEGQHITATGKYISSPKYGNQFKIESFETSMPDNSNEIAKYLASGLFEGVGPQTAARITGRFGKDTFDIIENYPERLCEIKGITSKKANLISENFKKLLEIKPIILFFQSHGLTPQNAMDAYYALGSSAISLIKENPYILTEENIAVSFKKADLLASKLGIAFNAEIRIKAMLKYILSHNLGNGHTFLPKEKLIETCAKIIKIEEESVFPLLEDLIISGELCEDEDINGITAIYLTPYYDAECYLASRIAAMVNSKPKAIPVDIHIEKREAASGIKFNDMQKKAVCECISSKISILTGGPGTGKTTTLLCILDVLEKSEKKVLLAAPTGRAAKRIEELTGREAKTIHRLLEMEKSSAKKYIFRKNEEDTLEADYIIIDEASMADVMLMSALFKATSDSTSIILVGDADQLPPVAAGNFFSNLVSSNCIKTIVLTKIFRQAAQSDIIVAAHDIIDGKLPNLKNNSKDFFFMPRSSETDVCLTVSNLVSTRLPEAYGFNPLQDIQVIAPTRLTMCGTEALNKVLQAALNYNNREENSITFKNHIFALGDKVMQCENDYEIPWTKDFDEGGKGLYNGDIGIITSVNKPMQMLTVRFDDKVAVYSYDMLGELEPAYAITVHKSQGSEFKAIIIPVFEAPKPLLNRCLLYTAVTRAKSLLIFVGKKETIAKMVENGKSNASYCGLKYLIRREFENE